MDRWIELPASWGKASMSVLLNQIEWRTLVGWLVQHDLYKVLDCLVNLYLQHWVEMRIRMVWSCNIMYSHVKYHESWETDFRVLACKLRGTLLEPKVVIVWLQVWVWQCHWFYLLCSSYQCHDSCRTDVDEISFTIQWKWYVLRVRFMVIVDRNEILKMQQNVVFVKIYDRKLMYSCRFKFLLLYVVFKGNIKIKWCIKKAWRSAAFRWCRRVMEAKNLMGLKVH